MAAPVDPYPNFVNNVDIADGDKVDARFSALYGALDKAATGLDENSIKNLAITTALLAAGAVTAAKIEAQQAWQTANFTFGSWNLAGLVYYKDSLGFVHVRGDEVQCITNPGTSTFATFPGGSRPGNTQMFFAIRRTTGAHIPIEVTSAGAVRCVTALSDGEVYSFAPIGFRAEL
jgi:hypothetical protein